MNWIGLFTIDPTGMVKWYEGMRIEDEAMKEMYRKNGLIGYLIDQNAVMGVKVGMA